MECIDLEEVQKNDFTIKHITPKILKPKTKMETTRKTKYRGSLMGNKP